MIRTVALFLVAGLLMAAPVKAEPPEIPMSREAMIMTTAKAEIAKRESWSQGAQFSVEAHPRGWTITAYRIRSVKNGRVKVAKECRTLTFDVSGTMTGYRRGK